MAEEALPVGPDVVKPLAVVTTLRHSVILLWLMMLKKEVRSINIVVFCILSLTN
jgi:hypothetical protein